MSEPRHSVWSMFDRISNRYDFLNHFLSLGLDVRWRSHMACALPKATKLHILDVATGTADVLLTLAKRPEVAYVRGVDMSQGMLELAKKKIQQSDLQHKAKATLANAEELPFASKTFDVVTIAFGIRNVNQPQKALKEMFRVLKPGGRLLVLEFSLPHNPWILKAYLFYFRHVLPRLGGWISGDSSAYRYLNRTVETFPYGERFAQWLTTAGFAKVSFTSLTLGIVTLYQADMALEEESLKQP